MIDVSDPAHPGVKPTAPAGLVLTYTVSVSGNHLCVSGMAGQLGGATWAHVSVLDLSNPTRPPVVGGVDAPEGSNLPIVTAQGSLLHLAYAGMNADPDVVGGYQVFDLSDPVNPSPLGLCELTVGEIPTTIRVAGNVACVLTHRALRIVDITDPRNPQVTSVVVHGANSPWTPLELAGQNAHLMVEDEMKVLDVTNPANPRQTGPFDAGFSTGLGISVEGNVAYLRGKGIRVLDVANPRVPTLVGATDDFGGELLDPWTSVGASDFRIVGTRAYVVGANSYILAGSVDIGFLQVFDLSNPLEPRELAFLEPFDYGGLDVVGNRAYVTGGNIESRLAVVDMADPVAPVELGSLILPDIAGAPQVVGDYAYVQLSETDLVIVDIRDPGQLVEVGRYHPPNQLNGFQVSGRYAYVFRSHPEDTSVHVVDLVNPANPARIGQYPYDATTVRLQSLYVSGHYVFVTLKHQADPPGRHRVDILDVGDPTQPVKVGEYHSEGRVSGMALAGNRLYTASDAGLTVLDFAASNVSPRLRLNAPVLSGGLAVLTWEGGPGIKLQKTPSLTTPNWQDVPGTTGQSLIALPPTDAAAFFRLIQP